jgi:hypothetical protein
MKASSAGWQPGVLVRRDGNGFAANLDDFPVEALNAYLVVLEPGETAELWNIFERFPHNRGVGAIGICPADVAGRQLFSFEKRGEVA